LSISANNLLNSQPSIEDVSSRSNPLVDREKSISNIAVRSLADISPFIERFMDESPFTLAPELDEIEIRPINTRENFLLAEVSMHETFKARDLRFERTEESPNVFICADSCFSDINSVVNSLSHPIKKQISRFYYSPEKRAICCEMSEAPTGHTKIEYPSGDEWMSLLRRSRLTDVPRLNELTLTSGMTLSETDFVNNPLFSNTLEKGAVYQRLCSLRGSEKFQLKYAEFLEKIRGSDLDWADSYRENSIEFAYLSLYAYLNTEIDQEELFVAQMLASAFTEPLDSAAYSPDTASYTVLTEENAKSHLRENQYISYLTSLFNVDCLKDIETKSLLKRTTVSFFAKEGGIEEEVHGSNRDYDLLTFGQVFIREGLRTTLLPPALMKMLYAETLKSDECPAPPLEHKEYFGYRRFAKDLFLGRPISRASPLFFMPEVHELSGHQLGVVAHDELFHCALDWINPYTNAFINCGKKVYNDQRLNGELRAISIKILDRGALVESVVDFFQEEVLKNLNVLPVHQQLIFFQICIECFPYKLLDQLLEIEMEEECLFLSWLQQRSSKF
jgi:hypothetical protein